jgi:hypothetical protein
MSKFRDFMLDKKLLILPIIQVKTITYLHHKHFYMKQMTAFFALRRRSCLSWKTRISIFLWLLIGYLTLVEACPIVP